MKQISDFQRQLWNASLERERRLIADSGKRNAESLGGGFSSGKPKKENQEQQPTPIENSASVPRQPSGPDSLYIDPLGAKKPEVVDAAGNPVAARIDAVQQKIPAMHYMFKGQVDRKKLKRAGVDLDAYMKLVAEALQGDKFANAQATKMREAAKKLGLDLPQPTSTRQVYSKKLGRMIWEVRRDEPVGYSSFSYEPIDMQSLEEEYAKKDLADKAAEAARKAKEAAERNRPSYGSVEIPYAEGQIIISVSPGLAQESSALQNLPGTQGANRLGTAPTIMLENRRKGLKPFYHDMRHRSSREQTFVHRDAETHERAFQQLGLSIAQTEDSSIVSIMRDLPKGEWIMINGHKITSRETGDAAIKIDVASSFERMEKLKAEQKERIAAVNERSKSLFEIFKEMQASPYALGKKMAAELVPDFTARSKALNAELNKDENVLVVFNENTFNKPYERREKIIGKFDDLVTEFEKKVQPYLDYVAEEERKARERLALAEQNKPYLDPVTHKVTEQDPTFVPGEVEVDLDTRTAFVNVHGKGKSVRVSTVTDEHLASPPADLADMKVAVDSDLLKMQEDFRKAFPVPPGSNLTATTGVESASTGASGIRMTQDRNGKKENMYLLTRREGDATVVDLYTEGKRRSVRIEGDSPTAAKVFGALSLRKQINERVQEKIKKYFIGADVMDGVVQLPAGSKKIIETPLPAGVDTILGNLSFEKGVTPLPDTLKLIKGDIDFPILAGKPEGTVAYRMLKQIQEKGIAVEGKINLTLTPSVSPAVIAGWETVFPSLKGKFEVKAPPVAPATAPATAPVNSPEFKRMEELRGRTEKVLKTFEDRFNRMDAKVVGPKHLDRWISGMGEEYTIQVAGKDVVQIIAGGKEKADPVYTIRLLNYTGNDAYNIQIPDTDPKDADDALQSQLYSYVLNYVTYRKIAPLKSDKVFDTRDPVHDYISFGDRKGTRIDFGTPDMQFESGVDGHLYLMVGKEQWSGDGKPNPGQWDRLPIGVLGGDERVRNMTWKDAHTVEIQYGNDDLTKGKKLLISFDKDAKGIDWTDRAKAPTQVTIEHRDSFLNAGTKKTEYKRAL
jgi:hypothetical protein